MTLFEEASLRLKQQLGIGQDKAVAEVLGLSPRAWAGRKQKDNFPEKELRAVAQQRPELGIDVGYVLTGIRSDDLERSSAVSEVYRSIEGLTRDEAMASLATRLNPISAVEQARAQLLAKAQARAQADEQTRTERVAALREQSGIASHIAERAPIYRITPSPTAAPEENPISSESRVEAEQVTPITAEEAQLLLFFRSANSAGRAAILLTARGVASVSPAS